VLDVLHNNFHKSLEDICKFTHNTFVEAVTGTGMRDFERLQPYALSLYHSRFCAGLITAVHKSGLLKVSDFDGFDAILELAEKPPGLLNKGEGFGAFLSPPRAASPLAGACSARMDVDGDDDTDEWHCPGCNAPASQVNESAITVYGLSRPTCNKFPGSCWCEDAKIDPSLKYCKLCVNYFRRFHQPRTEDHEKRRVTKSQKRKSDTVVLETNPITKRQTLAQQPVPQQPVPQQPAAASGVPSAASKQLEYPSAEGFCHELDE